MYLKAKTIICIIDKMQIKSFAKRILLCLAPISGIFIVFVILYIINSLFEPPACPSHSVLNFYCAGCGMTRAVRSLLSGDLFGSLHYNATLIFGSVLAFIAYILFVQKVFGRAIRLQRAIVGLMYVLLVFIVIYSITRNIFPVLAPI